MANKYEKSITIWAWGSFAQIANKAIKLFGPSFVVVELSPHEINNRLSFCLDIGAFDELPDIILMHDRDIKNFLKYYSDSIVILDNWFDTSVHAPCKIANITYKEHLYGVPCTSEPVALYYNKNLLMKIGEEEIREDITWDEFIDIGRRLRNIGVFLLPPATYFVQILMQSTGRLYYDADGQISADGSMETMELIQKLSNEGLLFPDSSISNDMVYDLIASGEIFSVIGAPYWFSGIKRTIEEHGLGQEWSLTKIPKSDMFQFDVDFGGYSWLVINKENIENQQAAIEFLLQIFNQENELSIELIREIAETYDMVPSVNYAWDILDTITNNGCFVDKQVIKYLLEISETVPEIYYGEFTGDITQNLFEIVTAIANGQTAASEGFFDFESICEEYAAMDSLPKLVRIEIEQAPEKTNYYKYEYFSNHGMIVRAYYDDGTDGIITGYNYTPNSLGLHDTHVTISYSRGGVTKTADQPVTVSNRKLTSLTVSTGHAFLQGDTITPNQFFVEANYDFGESRRVTASYVSPTKLSYTGEMDIFVDYYEDGELAEGTITITVYKKLESISISNKPKKLSYYKGERFNRAGMSAVARYSDRTMSTVSAGSLRITPEIVKFKNGQDTATLTISYTERGITKQTSITVYKKTGTDLEDCDITQDMAESGMGTLNLSTGKFTYKFNDFTGSDSIIPISVSHIYKDGIGDSFCMGTNWRLNVQQELIKTEGKWQYTDKEGKEYLFDDGYEIEKDRSSIRNEKLGMDLFEDEEKHSIRLIDRSNNMLVFKLKANKYRLTAMHMFPSTPDFPIDAYSLEISYLDDGKISTVTAGKSVDGKRPMVQFTYSNSRLTELQYKLSKCTVVARYSYNNGNLNTITLLNENVDAAFARSTKFEYEEKGFIVYDLSSKDRSGNYKALRYSLDSIYRVINYTIGYGEAEQDETKISYSSTGVSTEENSDISLSTVTENNGTVSIVAFNSMGVVSQYSYDIVGASHISPKKICSAQSRGFSYKSLSETYSDTLDVFHDDFETGTDGWSYATRSNKRGINGEYCICGTALSKSYQLTSDNIANDTTLYLSLWAAKNSTTSNISIKITVEGSESGELTLNLDKNLIDKWQFTALCLGKRKIGDTITVKVSCGSAVYLDDVRLTKLPYETPDDIANIVYDSFGNVTKSYQYNPIDKSVEITEYVYDSKHQMTQQTTLKAGKTQKNKINNTYENGLLTLKKEYGNSSSDFTQEQYIYTDKVMTSSIDVNNVVTKYAEGEDYTETVIVGEADSPEMKQREERFSNSDTVKSLSLGDLQNGYFYLTNGPLQKSKFNYSSVYNAEISFEYDTFGNLSALKIGNVALVTAEYDYKHLKATLYANGDRVSYTYDIKDRIIAVSENEKETVSINYSDNAEDLITVTHSDGLAYTSKAINKSGLTGEYSVRFSDVSRILRVEGHASNGAGNVTSVGYFIDKDETPFEKCTTTKDGNGLLTKIERSYHGANNSYVYDSLYRLSGKTTTYTTGSTSRQFKTNYYYNSFTGNRKGSRVTNEDHYDGISEKKSYYYDYYKNGNLKKVRLGSDAQSEFIYDEYGRLTEEYNFSLSRAFKFTYDNGGNITKKETYFITNGVVSASPIKTDIYNYETTTPNYGQNPDWKDQLKSYNGTAIKYDALGNPLNYLGKVMAWRGRKLISIDGVALDYDYNGLRVKKGDRTFYWFNGNLILESWGNNNENYIYYYYDESGVCGMNYNGKDYYYRKNILGDVIAVYDNFGNLQCRYVYDAWGNHKVYNASGSEIAPEIINVGNVNPFRYRGYYWDREFNLYYLKSRYYDPALGRFISADDVSYLDPQSVVGFNLYAYCGNNPVMGYDPEGSINWWAALAVVAIAIVAVAVVATATVLSCGTATPVLVGAAIGAGVSGVTSMAIQGATTGEIDWGQVIVDTAIGGVMGAFGGSTIGCAGMTIAGGATGFLGSIANDIVAGQDVNWGIAIASGAGGAFFGFLSGGGVQNGINATYKSKLLERQNRIAQGKSIRSIDLQIKNEKHLLKANAIRALKPDCYTLYTFALDYVINGTLHLLSRIF